MLLGEMDNREYTSYDLSVWVAEDTVPDLEKVFKSKDIDDIGWIMEAWGDPAQ